MDIVKIILEKYIRFKNSEYKKQHISVTAIVLMICICVSALSSLFCIFQNVDKFKTLCIIFEAFFTVVLYLYVENNIKKGQKNSEYENFIDLLYNNFLSELRISSANQILRLIARIDELIKATENTFDNRKKKVETVINSVISPVLIAITSSLISIHYSNMNTVNMDMNEILILYINVIICITIILITSSAVCEIIDWICAHKKSVNLINLYKMRNDLSQIVDQYYLFSHTYEQIAVKEDDKSRMGNS